MPRLFQALALAASAAGLLASAVPTAAAPAFDAAHQANVHSGMENVVHHSRDHEWRDHEWRDRDRDRYRERDHYRYRDGRYYGSRGYNGEPVRADTRVWRGRDGRYYCRREDGTAGLLIGGVVGGLIGNEVAGHGDRTVGTILGVAGGALLGRAIDRSDSRCR